MNVQGALAHVDSSDCGGHGLPLPFPRRSGSRTRHPSGRGRLAGGRADRAPGRIRARDPRRFRSDQPCGVSPRTAAARPGGGGPGTGIDREVGGSRGRFPNGNPPPAFQRPHPPVSADSLSIRDGAPRAGLEIHPAPCRAVRRPRGAGGRGPALRPDAHTPRPGHRRRRQAHPRRQRRRRRAPRDRGPRRPRLRRALRAPDFDDGGGELAATRDLLERTDVRGKVVTPGTPRTTRGWSRGAAARTMSSTSGATRRRPSPRPAASTGSGTPPAASRRTPTGRAGGSNGGASTS